MTSSLVKVAKLRKAFSKLKRNQEDKYQKDLSKTFTQLLDL